MLRRIAITGPESTGKTTLAKQLALHFDTVWVSEFARNYLNSLHRPYQEVDLLEIAKGQLLLENQGVSNAKNGLLFCDSDFTVLKIWSEVKYGRCDTWIDEQFEQHRYDCYLLCAPDLAWEIDPLRENPDDRDFLFDLYQKNLDNINANYHIINGIGIERLEKAIAVITQLTQFQH